MHGIEENRPTGKSTRPLRALLPFVWPYRLQLGLALLFLVLSAAATLSLPIAVRQVIDLGFSRSNAGVINTYFWALFGVAVLMAFASGLRFYWVSWLGERVVADIRDALYRQTGLFQYHRQRNKTDAGNGCGADRRECRRQDYGNECGSR